MCIRDRAYWDQFEKSPELVVMYLPGESFFSSALEQDHTLIQSSAEKKIILATPTTLLALLKAIAYGWQQEDITRNALEMMSICKELYNRFAVVTEHYEKIGKSLSVATKSYNDCLASMQTRLIPYLRKIKETGISTKKDIVEAKEIDIYCKESNLLNIEFEKKENKID
ncbi:MAG: DNA recombination protein RmuC, partial [Thermodesulfovibrionales bacterium]|nr:DNA recombination protein RmuC [Thermodesulfovibrionales bacterium]